MEQERQEQILSKIDETLERYHDDHLRSVEETMVMGLEDAVARGWMSQDEMDRYLLTYIQNRDLSQHD
jgi:hypothetical protein